MDTLFPLLRGRVYHALLEEIMTKIVDPESGGVSWLGVLNLVLFVGLASVALTLDGWARWGVGELALLTLIPRSVSGIDGPTGQIPLRNIDNDFPFRR